MSFIIINVIIVEDLRNLKDSRNVILVIKIQKDEYN